MQRLFLVGGRLVWRGGLPPFGCEAVVKPFHSVCLIAAITIQDTHEYYKGFRKNVRVKSAQLLVKCNANNWSSLMLLGGQIGCNFV